MVNKSIIRNNFSRYARYYDRYSAIQNLCAARLINQIKGDFNRILDVGCGTGNYTMMLSEKFPQSTITALDISRAMVAVAEDKLNNKAVEFVVADAEDVRFNRQFDLITSNASFQWFDNLLVSLANYHQLLSNGGSIFFSSFGPLTFSELSSCLSELTGRPPEISAGDFADRSQLSQMLQGIFTLSEVKEFNYKESYPSLLELLRTIKYTGTRGNGVFNKGFLSSRVIDELEKIYKSKFKAITATYQVFFCRGFK